MTSVGAALARPLVPPGYPGPAGYHAQYPAHRPPLPHIQVPFKTVITRWIPNHIRNATLSNLVFLQAAAAAPPRPAPPPPLKELCKYPHPVMEGVGSVTVTMEDYRTLQVNSVELV